MKYLFNRFNKTSTEIEILNSGLEFAMEFGKNWLKPVQQRLLSKYGVITQDELDKYDQVSREVMNSGHKYIYDSLSKLYDDQHKIGKDKLQEAFNAFILDKYKWVNQDNLSHLFSQGCYYAWKEGLASCIVGS